MKRRILKITGYFILSIFLLIGLLAIALNTSSVQNYLSDKILKTLSEKYNAEFNIEEIKIDFMDEVILKGVLFQDQNGDTLFAARSVMVDLGLVNLFGREIRLDEINIVDAKSHIYDEDGKINFAFLFPEQQAATENNNRNDSKPWDISLGSVNLTNPQILVELDGQVVDVNLSMLAANFTKTDFSNSILSLSSLGLDGLKLNYTSPEKSTSQKEFVFPDLGWNISVNSLEVEESQINYFAKADSLNISDLFVIMEDIKLGKEEISAESKGISFILNDKLHLDDLKTKLKLIGDEVSLSNLIVKTDNDKLSGNTVIYGINQKTVKGDGFFIDVDFQTLNDLKSYLPSRFNLAENAGMKADIGTFSYFGGTINATGLTANYGDIMSAKGNFKLNPTNASELMIDSEVESLNINLQKASKLWDGLTLPDSLKMYKNLTLSGKIEGLLDDFQINNFKLSIDDVLDLEASGAITNITDSDLLNFDIEVNRLSTKVSQLPLPEIDKIALDSLGTSSFTGKLSGTLKELIVKGDLDSGLGSLKADLIFNIPKKLADISYKGDLELKKFDIGTLLKNEQLDVVSIKLNLDGKGLDFNNLNSKIDGVISDFAYNGYTYSDIGINAEISDRKINGKLQINDKNAKLSYEGIIHLDSMTTILDFTTLIDTLNLEALGFTNQLFTISGEIDSQIRLPLRSGEEGKIDILNLVLANGLESFKEDSIAIRAKKSSDSTFVSIAADFAEIEMEGKFGIRDLPASIGEMVDYYVRPDTSFIQINQEGESLSMKGQIRTLAPVNIILPGILVQAGMINFNTNLDFLSKKVNGEISIDSFFVSSFFSEKLNLNLDSGTNDIYADLIGKNNTLAGSEIAIVDIKNILSKQRFTSAFEAKDEDGLPRLSVTIDTDFEDGYTQLALKDSLVLNKKDWTASEDNAVKIYPDKLIIENLALTDNNEFLTISSTDPEGNGLNIDFKNFNIGQFTTLITSKPARLTGNINGSIDLLDLNRDLYYLVNLKVEDMVYDSTSVGVLTIQADDNQSTGILTTDISLMGKEFDVKGGGTYNTKSTALNFDLDIKAFEMLLLDPFLSEIIKDSRGKVTGNVSLDGTADKPILDGALTLNDVVTTIVVNNTRYGIEKQTVTFDNNSIDIGVFDIFDAKNNLATLSGKIYHSFLQDMRLDMNLSTDEFTFLNTTSADNPVFFGKMVLGADVDLSGPISLLDVNVVAKTLDSTEINISPFSIEKFLLEEAFITYGKPSDFEDQTNEYLLKLARQFPFKVNIILDATQDAKMNFVIDPVTGDKIEGRGNGNLRIKLNPDGQQEIFGTYTITEGAYTFSYGDFVSKDFKVKPGGTVKFNGNPLNAILDISAIYTVYTTTYELIKNEISTSENEVAAAQRRTNVDVYLSLKGTLDEPLIKLDIQIPDLESATLISTIDRKLSELRSNLDELNNQVFGLLIFNSFILSDNVASGFGNLGSNIALSSVSSLISNQLNNLADKVVKGVDVDINVNSYDSNYANEGAGGTVTEVGLKVSKQLFNDRLSISAGGNLDFSSQTNAQSYSSLIGDFVLEYKLTENGGYRVRVFSKSDYDRLLNQNTNKNGVSLFFNKAFDSKLDD